MTIHVVLWILFGVALLSLVGLWPLLLGIFYLVGYVLYWTLTAVVFLVALVIEVGRKLGRAGSRPTPA